MEEMSPDESVDHLFGGGDSASEAAANPGPKAGARKRGASRIVLVVDDSAPMRKLICAMIHKAGHLPLEAENGTVALEMVRSQSPRLILLDVLMPGLSGIDTLKQLRMMPGQKQTPVVLLTSVRDADVISEAGKYGVSDYLAKPTTTEKLNAKIGKYLD